MPLAAPSGATGFHVRLDLHVLAPFLVLLVAPNGVAGFHVRSDLHVLVPPFLGSTAMRVLLVAPNSATGFHVRSDPHRFSPFRVPTELCCRVAF